MREQQEKFEQEMYVMDVPGWNEGHILLHQRRPLGGFHQQHTPTPARTLEHQRRPRGGLHQHGVIFGALTDSWTPMRTRGTYRRPRRGTPTTTRTRVLEGGGGSHRVFLNTQTGDQLVRFVPTPYTYFCEDFSTPTYKIFMDVCVAVTRGHLSSEYASSDSRTSETGSGTCGIHNKVSDRADEDNTCRPRARNVPFQHSKMETFTYVQNGQSETDM